MATSRCRGRRRPPARLDAIGATSTPRRRHAPPNAGATPRSTRSPTPYIINELNINSAISSPGHGEVLKLNECGPTYDVKGYAYGGGGRKIIRVEVTLDGGKSWHLVEDGNVTHPPDTPTPAGKYWGWCMWTITVPTSDLLKATNVACRAWSSRSARWRPSLRIGRGLVKVDSRAD